jgi:hypothetical protein
MTNNNEWETMGDAVRKTGRTARKIMLSAARNIVKDLENNKLYTPDWEANINILAGGFCVLSNAISMTAFCRAHSTGKGEGKGKCYDGDMNKGSNEGKGSDDVSKSKGKDKCKSKGKSKGQGRGQGRGMVNAETEVNDVAKINDQIDDMIDVKIKRSRRSNRRLLNRCDDIARIALDPICVKAQTPTMSTASSSSASDTFKPSWNAIKSDIGKPLWSDIN